MMHTEWQFLLNNVCKIFYLDHIRHDDCKIEFSKYLKRFFGVLRSLLPVVTKATEE